MQFVLFFFKEKRKKLVCDLGFFYYFGLFLFLFFLNYSSSLSSSVTCSLYSSLACNGNQTPAIKLVVKKQQKIGYNTAIT